jgi:predicted Zn finger-like uncharacterized protein
MLITCPACRNQLRLQDEFLGRRVRCPLCNDTFEATPEPPASSHPAAPPPPPEEVNYDPGADSRARPRRHYDDDYDDYDDRPRRRREKPGRVQAIAIMILIGGIMACVGSLGWLIAGIASMGLCCLWPGAYYSAVLDIMAIIKGSQLLGRDDWRQQPPSAIAIMQIINIVNGDVANCVMGILTLVFLNEPEVRRYYRG